MSSPKYAVYARKSTESEERQIQSIDDQVRLATELLGGAPSAVVTEAMSAKEPDRRPEFRRLLGLVERGAVDTIVAWHPDRLSRNEMDAARICYLVRTGKLNLRFVNYFFDNSPEGMMMLQMALSQSQYYSSKLSKDVLRGLDSRVAKGWWPGKAPEGYVNDLEAHTVVPDPERLPLIERAFRLLLTGAYSVTEVLQIMNDDWGYRTKRRKNTGGGRLSRSAAFRLFANPFYAGWMELKGELRKGSHPAILTLEEFNRVQELVKVRQNYRTHTEYAYNGLIRCGHCGGTAVAELQKGRHTRGGWIYYRCHNRACPGPGGCLREEHVDAEVERHLRELTWPREFAQAVLAEFDGFLKTEFGDIELMRKQRQSALAAVERKRSSLLELRLAGEIEAAIYAEKDRDLRAQLQRLQGKAESVETAAERAREAVRRMAEFRVHAYGTFQAGGRVNRREMAAALGTSYRLERGQLVIERNPLLPRETGPFEPLKSGSEKQKGTRFLERVPHGWEGGILIEAFRAALSGAGMPDASYAS